MGTGAPGPVKAPRLTAELISDSGTINPGGETRVALALALEPGWHVYCVYAEHSGEAPEVQWSAPPGISMGPMQYAAPSRLPLGPLMDYGYEGTTVFPFDVTASSQVPPGVVDLNLNNNGGSWVEDGVSYERVVRRVQPEIEGRCPELWEYLKPQLEAGRHKGFFAASALQQAGLPMNGSRLFLEEM